MAKFLNFFPIGSISDDNVHLGLSPDSVDGTVINTLDQNIVFRLELSHQKQIASWTSEQKLSHKVVYDFKSKKYVGVFGSRIQCWSEENKQIKKGKIKLPRPVEEIISFDNQHTILVYKDGTCESLESCSTEREANWKPLAPIVDEKTHNVINIACFNTVDKHVMLTYFLSHKQTGVVEFVYFLLNDDMLTPTANVHRIEISRIESAATLVAFTVVEGTACPSVMTIWSDKRIFMLPIRCGEATPTNAGSYVTMFDCLRVDKQLTIVSVSKNCIAIYGGNTQQDGASLVLYNTHYCFAQCKQHFKVHLANCRLWVIGKYILMAVGQRLTCARFRISQDKLSDIIGSKMSIEWNGNVNNEIINEESELEQNVSFNRAQAKKFKGTRNDSAETMVHSESPERFDKFNTDLSSMYHHDIDIDILQDDSLPSSRRTRTMVHAQDRLYSSEEVASLVEVLEKYGRSEWEITECVIPLLIKSKLPNELTVCLRQYTNIPEQMLAQSLKFFVGMQESDAKLAFINQVLACSFHKDLIKEHLRTNLNLDDAIYLLQLIHRYLEADETLLEESPQYGHDFDGDGVLMNWFTVILDAHHQQFLLARDSNLEEMVVKWKALIESFVCDIRELKSLNAKLQCLVNGKLKQTDNTSSKWYSVEMIKLY